MLTLEIFYQTNLFIQSVISVAGGIFIFYVIFYGLLAVFFAICMKGLLMTIDDNTPKWTLDSSIIGTNPGIAAFSILPLEFNITI